MARGWESKSVEMQQAEALDSTGGGRRLTVAQAAEARKREGLELTRKRVLQQLAAVRDARHRRMLEDALADLDRQLQAGPPGS